MPIPKPSKGQSKSDYMSKCMSFLKDEGKGDQKQRVAICLDTWRRNNEDALVSKMNLMLQEQDEECPPGKVY